MDKVKAFMNLYNKKPKIVYLGQQEVFLLLEHAGHRICQGAIEDEYKYQGMRIITCNKGNYIGFGL